jgi:hypothetical protein
MATLILAATLVILVGAFGIMFVSGWRFQPLQPRAGRASASVEKWSPPLGPGESASSRIKRLAHDVSSLSIAPTNRPDPSKVLDEARALAEKGQYEESLQRHIWYHNHALEYGPSQAGVRISFALSDWIELGRKYPKARRALMEIRDRDNREFAEGRGNFGLFQEVSAINGYLQTEDDTVALFKGLLKQDPELARRCYPVVEDLLVQKGEYDLCLSLIPDAAEKFDSIRREWERGTKLPRVNSPMAPNLQEFADRRFVAQTRALIEILVATGHQPEAEQIRLQAVALRDDPRLASAVADAEKKVPK